MSLKAKLVSTIAAFCMVICLLSVGIWAASTGTVNIGGTVSFTAEDVDVAIYVGWGLIDEDSDAEVEISDTALVTWNAASTTNTADWTDLDLEFAKGKDIKLAIKVVNNSEQRSVTVELKDDETTATTATNYTHTPNVPTASATLEAKGSTATDASNEGVYTITLKVTDWNKVVAGNLNYDLVVKNVG